MTSSLQFGSILTRNGSEICLGGLTKEAEILTARNILYFRKVY